MSRGSTVTGLPMELIQRGRTDDPNAFTPLALAKAVGKVCVFLGIGVLLYAPGVGVNSPAEYINTTEVGGTAWGALPQPAVTLWSPAPPSYLPFRVRHDRVPAPSGHAPAQGLVLD